MSLPLIDGQGNFGSVDGDPAAAMRYTETKLSKVSQHLIDDIEKNTVSFKSNYDETEKEPEVLPSQFPNILVNGAGGIAVGMATSIPPHNLKEVVNATLTLIDNKRENKNTTLKQLMELIKGPDFPTRGIVIGKQSIKEGYDKGKSSSSFKIRGNINIEQIKGGRERLVITSIPYQVNKAILTEKIAQLVREKKIEGIRDIRDESNSEGIRLVIDLRNGIEPETIKRLLYKNTSIESSFGFNMLAIVDGKPEQCGLLKFLNSFLSFREDVVLKKTKFDLEKAQARSHILIGLSISVENIDKIIKIIRSSKNPEDAKKILLKTNFKVTKSQKFITSVEGKSNKKNYLLTEKQVEAILELKLQKLTAIGIDEIESELDKLLQLITKYKKIINSKKELLKVISDELINIRNKYGVDRRTEIDNRAIDSVLNYNIEETIQKESVLITVTLKGYIKRSSLSNVKQQKRGGKGKTGIKTRDEDSVIQTLSVDTHTAVIFFSNEGLAYKLKAWKIPEGTSVSRGKSLFNILPLKNHQSISSIMPLPDENSNTQGLHIIFATSKGKVRKNSLDDFSSINSSGKIAMKLENDDKIIGVKICKEDEDIILSTKLGKCIRFESSKLRVFKGRSSKGIKGLNLTDNDSVVSLSIIDGIKSKKNGSKSKDTDKIDKKNFILAITENGYGKRTSHLDFRVTNRGGKGIIGIVNSKRNGNVSSSFPVFEGDEILISTNKGRVIRTSVREIRVAGRNTQGVRIIKLSGDEKVVSAIKIDDNLI